MMGLPMKDLLGLENLTKENIELILDNTKSEYKKESVKNKYFEKT